MRVITPLKLGDRLFPNNIIQGPLAGISSAPFRLLTSRFGQPAFTCTEMISCKTLLHQPALAQRRYVARLPEEGPVCYQLSANNPNELAEATRIVTEYGADLIDLNCGCPVKKIRSKGAGSSLLMDPLKLSQMIASLKKNTHVPVSIKIRIDGNSNDRFNHEIAQVIHDSGLDFLIVHGRHWTEHYDIPCNHEQIAFFVKALSIPVIGNGDIQCVDSLTKMFATGCSGVMLSRAGVGQPWLARKLMAAIVGEPFETPTPVEIAAVLKEHIQMLIGLLASEKMAILQARKFAKYYARDLAVKNAFNEAVNQCHSYQEMENVIHRYLGD